MVSFLWTTVIAAGVVTPAIAGDIPQDIAQERLVYVDCLPGPLIDDTFLPSCLTTTAKGNSTTSSGSGHEPWTYPPYCAGEAGYCAYTNANIYGTGRGVSVIDGGSKDGKPPAVSAAERIANAAVQLSPKELDPDPPFEVRDIPGKGKGLVATRKIPRGKVFMIDRAAVIADADMPAKMLRSDGHDMLWKAFEQHPLAVELLDLARSSLDQDDVPAPEDIMKTNSFNVEIGGKSYIALFPRIARMNHACRPSAITRFNETDFSNTVFAFHDIMPGDEIAISYSSFGLTSAGRQHTLLSKWGFNCTCSLCSSPPEELAASDARRAKIHNLGEEVISLLQKGGGDPETIRRAATLYEEAVHAVEEEGLVPHMGNHYDVLAKLVAATGNVERARELARKAKEEREGFEGNF